MSISTVAILGGAFDPVHRDHILIASYCLSLKLCDEVWFVPSPNRWDKTLHASAEDRFAMLKLVTAKNPHFFVSDFEIQMGDFRGSYVSMMRFKERFPDKKFRLLVGADSYIGIPHWRDPLHFFGTEYNGSLLLQNLELIVFARNGYRKPDMEKHIAAGYAPLHWVGKEHGFNGTISSTFIRHSLYETRRICPKGLDKGVFEYILQQDLYRE